MLKSGRTTALVAFAIVVALGCSKGNPNAPASIHGRVLLTGKPVTGGTLTFHAPTGARYVVKIDPEGNYSGTDLPAGDNLTVTVETESTKPVAAPKITYGKAEGQTGGPEDTMAKLKSMGRAPKDVGQARSTAAQGVYVKIPPRYKDKETSPLRVSMTAGDQKKDFELTE